MPNYFDTHQYLILRPTGVSVSNWTQNTHTLIDDEVAFLPGTKSYSFGEGSNIYGGLGDRTVVIMDKDEDLMSQGWYFGIPQYSGVIKNIHVYTLAGFDKDSVTTSGIDITLKKITSGTPISVSGTLLLPRNSDPYNNIDWNITTWSKYTFNVDWDTNDYLNTELQFYYPVDNISDNNVLEIDALYLAIEPSGIDQVEYLPLMLNGLGQGTGNLPLFLNTEETKSIPMYLGVMAIATGYFPLVSAAYESYSGTLPLNISGLYHYNTFRPLYLYNDQSATKSMPLTTYGLAGVGGTFFHSSGMPMYISVLARSSVYDTRPLFLLNTDPTNLYAESRPLYLQVDNAKSFAQFLNIYLQNLAQSGFLPLALLSNPFGYDEFELPEHENYIPFNDNRPLFLGQFSSDGYIPIKLKGEYVPISGMLNLVIPAYGMKNSGLNLSMPYTFDTNTNTLSLYSHGY